MENLDFDDFDTFLIQNKGKIIHQIWFGLIPDKRTAKKAFKSLKKYRDSWIINNPDWCYICWDYNKCRQLLKSFYPQHLEMYDRYTWLIQKCDAVRYFILHRYGGLYADMDYHCNKPWNEVIKTYPNDIYLVETPNKINNESIHISNSLMYSAPGHYFWNKIFIELEIYQKSPMYYSRHMVIMFTTGPGILNRVYNRYKVRFKLNYYPFKKFHPYGLTSDIKTLQSHQEVYAIHLGKGSWETNDSKIIIFLYQECKILSMIILILVVPLLLYSILTYNNKLKNVKYKK